MVDRIRWDTVSYLPFYYVFFQFLLLTIFNLQANILTTKDILSNLGVSGTHKGKGDCVRIINEGQQVRRIGKRCTVVNLWKKYQGKIKPIRSVEKENKKLF